MLKKVVSLMMFALAAGLVGSQSAAAQTACGDTAGAGGTRVECACGSEVTTNYTMGVDLNCSGDTSALIIKNPNITINGQGHTITGSGEYTTKKRAAIDVWGTATNFVFKNITVDGGGLFPGKWRTCMEIDAANATVGDTTQALRPWDTGWAPSVTLKNCGRVQDMNGDGVTKDEFYRSEVTDNADYNGDGDELDTNVMSDEAIGYAIDARGPNMVFQGLMIENIGDEGIHFVSGQNPNTSAANDSKIINSKFVNVTHEAIYFLMNGSTVFSPAYGSQVKGNLVTLNAGAYQDSETLGAYLKHAHDIWVEGNKFVYNGAHVLGNSNNHRFKNNEYTYGARIKLSDYKCKDMVYQANWDGAGNNYRGSNSGECCGYAGGTIRIGSKDSAGNWTYYNDVVYPAQPTHCSYRQFPKNNQFDGEVVDGTFQAVRDGKDADLIANDDFATDYCVEVNDAEETQFTNATFKNCDDSLVTGTSYYHFNVPQTATYTPFAGDPVSVYVAPTTTYTYITNGTFDRATTYCTNPTTTTFCDADTNTMLTTTEVEIENASYYVVTQTATQTLDVLEDSHIRNQTGYETGNNGNSTSLYGKASPTTNLYISMMKFQRFAPSTATITNQSAVLKMTNSVANANPALVFSTVDSNWSEMAVTWNNYSQSNILSQVATLGGVTGQTAIDTVANSTSITSGFNFDVNNYITFAVKGPTAGTQNTYYSRSAVSGTKKPQLLYTATMQVTWGGTTACIKPASGSFSCVPTDDAHMRNDTPNAGAAQYDMYGDQKTMHTSSASADQIRKSILKFDITRINASVASAKVRLHRFGTSANNFTVYRLNDRTTLDGWTEWGMDADGNGNPDGQDDEDYSSDGKPVTCNSGSAARNGYQNYAACCNTGALCTKTNGNASEGVTWANLPATFGTSVATSAQMSGGSSWWEADITAEVNAEISSGNKVVTLVLVDNGTSTADSEWDSRNGSPDAWPVLVIQ